MKKLIVGICILLPASAIFAAGTNEPAFIPLPQRIERFDNAFKLMPQTRICTDWASRETGEFLAARLRQSTGYPLKVAVKLGANRAVPNAILLTTRSADTNLGAEGYALTVATNSVVVRAPTQAGLFYGVQTLLQLLPPGIFSTNLVTNADWQMPCVQIEDWPRFKWRGLMLDVSRHFYNKGEVEQILDLMARYKLNTFHWHLVDDDGWRIEIKKYPRLTEVGAWRKSIGWGLDPKSSSAYNSNGQYGGYYTQNDIREVVACAAARHIIIVPEIEMPGHSRAALAAYPQFSCFGGPYSTDRAFDIHGKYSSGSGIYNPANEGTFQFLDGVLAEVFQLFPGKYIHIGGDEVQKDYWAKSPDCQALMKREGLENGEELQSWFTKRIEKFVNAHGKTLIGWSEILQGGLAQNAVVMDWIGGGREAASEGHDVVMSPTAYCYFDHYQSKDRATEPRAIGGFLPLNKVYSFDPIPTNLPPQLQSHILGAQGNLWTEYVASLPHAEYMVFPRLCALAEVAWSDKNSRDWNDFQSRLKVDEQRLDKPGVNYRHDTSAQMSAIPSARVTTDFIDAKISPDYPGFTGLSIDSLGRGHFSLIAITPPAKPWVPTQAVQHGSRVEYQRPGADSSEPPRWAIEIGTNEIQLESHWSADDPPEPLVLNADNSVCHLTLLGLMETNGSIQLPAIMHLPDQGSFRISAVSGAIKSLGYPAEQYQAGVIQIAFPGATRENPVVKYRWEVVSFHPKIPGIDTDARFDGFRRNWLNIFQLSPRWRMLANHVTSDTCAFCYYEYADVAKETPQLATNLTALDMVRQTLDRIFNGATGYGMPGHGSFPDFSADTYPSLLIAAEDYIEGSQDNQWLAANYEQLKSWTDKMLATDHDGNGLVEYTLSGDSGSWPAELKYRPANWWDTIGFGHEDAYANALAYRALRGMEELAGQSNHSDDQLRYRAAADKLKAAYFKTFYDPATGILAGWRSADGQRHDYYFLWVNGIAIHYGLVPRDQANSIMDHLLAKMREVGYTRFDLGLPGNLIPVAIKDYVDHNPRYGGGTNEDNSDGFQIYKNGGATACFAYFTLAALYDLGRIDEADKILFPMLDAFANGNFQGRCDNKMSRDWKAWDGTCWGYEGFLTDNYYALLAVLDREAAIKRGGEAVFSRGQ